MIDLVFLIASIAAPSETRSPIACDGIRMIEASMTDRPLPFASLREQSREMVKVRNAQGQRVDQMVSVTNVKAINGFARCRFVYTSQIDLACYTAPSYARSDVENVSAALDQTALALRQCLNNTKLVQGREEIGSSPVITFGAGPREAFWQVTMVPLLADENRLQPEILVLPPVHLATPAPQPLRKAAKTKRARTKAR